MNLIHTYIVQSEIKGITAIFIPLEVAKEVELQKRPYEPFRAFRNDVLSDGPKPIEMYFNKVK